MDLNVNQRSEILSYASGLLDRDDRRDPVKVGQASIPLIEWAEKAPGPADLSARMKAMFRHNANLPPGFTGGPAEFVENAGLYYAMLTGGQSVPDPRAETARRMRELIRAWSDPDEEA